MNAIPAVSQAPANNGAAQIGSAASADSAGLIRNGPDFAAALSNTGSKLTRKPAAGKAHDGGSTGGPLPVPGNLSPPSTFLPALPPTLPVTPAVATAASAATPVGGTVSGAAAPGAAAVPLVIPDTQAKGADQNSHSVSHTPLGAASASTAAAGLWAGFAPALGLPVADPNQGGVASGDGAATTSTAAGVAVAAKGAAAPAAAAASRAQAGAAAGAVPSTAGKPMAAAATAAINAATSGPSTADAGMTAGTTLSATTGTGTTTDAAAQAVAAAAMSSATGAVAPGAAFAGAADSPSTPDDLATPATGAAAHGPRRPNGAPPAAPAISISSTAAAAWPKAAAAASAVTALAIAGAEDKRAPGGTGDSLPAGEAAGAVQMSVNTAGVTDATPTPTPTLKVSAGVDTPEFGQGLADRVSWMVDNNLNGAKLQVNPPQLGPIEVRIAVQGNHAQVWLTSHSAVTRDALESSSPKLREMLGAQGFGQVSVDISQRSFQERSAYSQPYEWAPSASGSPSAAAVQSTAGPTPRISIGAVDAYA